MGGALRLGLLSYDLVADGQVVGWLLHILALLINFDFVAETE